MMKRIISLVLAVVFAAGVFSLEAAYAAGGSELPEIPIEPPETKYFKGVKKEDKTFKITGYTGKDSVIAVPSRKYGLVVTEIGDGAFKGLNITGVTVPDSVTAVGQARLKTACSSSVRLLPIRSRRSAGVPSKTATR